MKEDDIRNIILDFPCLFDTDYGTISYLIYSCENSEYLQEGYRNWTTYFTKCKLVSRPLINPLSAIIKEDYLDQIDSLYNDLKEKYWKRILNISRVTDVLKLINMTYDYSGYFITVNCSNSLEEDIVKLNFPKWNTVINNTDRDSYFCYFFYDLDKSLETLPFIIGKSIYVLYIKPNFINFKQHVLNISAMPYIDRNHFKIISPYRDLQLPYDMTPNDMEGKDNVKKYQLKKQRGSSSDQHSSRTSTEKSSTESS